MSQQLPEHSKPVSVKTQEIVENGYDEGHFAENYWLTPDAGGGRRIDRSAGALIRYTRRLIELGVLPKEPRVLDISAGPGMIVHQFRQEGFRCEGCEFSESGRRIAMAEFGIDLLHGDLRAKLPYECGSFDFAMCVGVLTMIPEKYLQNALVEIRRVLSMCGIAHLHLMNPDPIPGEPHITSLPFTEWWGKIIEVGFSDITSMWSPQREGIGMDNEFSGIFLKA